MWGTAPRYPFFVEIGQQRYDQLAIHLREGGYDLASPTCLIVVSVNVDTPWQAEWARTKDLMKHLGRGIALGAWPKTVVVGREP